MKMFLSIVFGSLFVFIFSWLVVYKTGLNPLSIQSEDSVPTMFLPYAILDQRTLYLDKYYDQMLSKYPQPDDKDYQKGNLPFYLTKVDGHYLSAFPIMTSLLVLPVYVFPVLMQVPPTWENLTLLSHISAGLIVSLSGGLIYLIMSLRLGLSRNKALLLTIVYLFATVNFAMISQALWQHGTVQFFILLGIYFMLGYFNENRTNYLFWSGLFFSFAVLSRPTAMLVWIFVFILVILKRKRYLATLPKILAIYILGILLSLGFFLLYNNQYYKSIDNQGYSAQMSNSWKGNFPESFFGVWVSPSKGILIYSPVLIFSIFGLFLAYKSRTENKHEYQIYGLIIFFHTLVISFWKHWYGGWSYGYRMSSDIIPFLILAMEPFITSRYFEKYKRLFFFLIFISIFVQIFGIVFFDGVWHAAYDRGFKDTSWLWSIKDSEFVFNVRRILVKLGFLTKACEKCLPQM